MVKDEIATCCKALKLSCNLVDNCETIQADTHQEYLLKLLRLELEHRNACRMRNSLMKQL